MNHPISPQHSTPDLSFRTATTILFIGAAIMGLSPVFVREAGVDAFASAFWRVFFALPVLLVWAFVEAKKRNKSLNISVTKPGVLAGLFFAGDLVFWHLAILNTTLANATFMACLAPVWVALFANAFIGEKVSAKSILGLGICLVGAGLLINSSFRIDPSRLLGDIYGIITSVFLGCYFLAMRSGRKSSTSGELLLVSTLVTALVLFLIAIVYSSTLFPDTLQGYLSLIALGVVTHTGGQGLVAVALGSLTAIFSSLVIFMEAITAAFFGWLIFDEHMGIEQIFGGILILIGVWAARPSEQN